VIEMVKCEQCSKYYRDIVGRDICYNGEMHLIEDMDDDSPCDSYKLVHNCDTCARGEIIERTAKVKSSVCQRDVTVSYGNECKYLANNNWNAIGNRDREHKYEGCWKWKKRRGL